MTTPSTITERLDLVRERIVAAGGDPDTVRILAMTKGFEADVIRSALAAGLVDLGENYAQELLGKIAAIESGAAIDDAAVDRPVAQWHFAGRLQSNKVRQLAPHVALWQSLDRASVVREVAKRAPGARVLIQVNGAGEEQKGGCAPPEVPSLVETAQELGLEVRGLMTIGPTDLTQDPRPIFELVRELAGSLDLAECSMGMTHDLEHAVAEGSTIVRIGRALFGPRPPRDEVAH